MLPMPRIVKRWTYSLVDKVLFKEILQVSVVSINLWTFCFLLSAATFGFNLLAVQAKSEALTRVKSMGGKHNAALMGKWKSERDVWITGFALSLYVYD